MFRENGASILSPRVPASPMPERTKRLEKYELTDLRIDKI